LRGEEFALSSDIMYLITEELERIYWGYRIIYHPQCKDYKGYGGGLLSRLLRRNKFTIKKEDMKWERKVFVATVSGLAVKISRGTGSTDIGVVYYIYVDNTNRIVLFR
jgi:hypothetical protein